MTHCRVLQWIQRCLVLSVRPFVRGLPWRGSVMPLPRLTKENGAPAPNLTVLADVLVKKSLLLSPSYWLGIRVNRLSCFSFPLGDNWRRGREAMNSQITFSRANSNVQYFEAGQQGHRNLTHAVNRSDGNGLTVKLHAAVVQVKTIFYCWSGNTEKEGRLDLWMRGVGC